MTITSELYTLEWSKKINSFRILDYDTSVEKTFQHWLAMRVAITYWYVSEQWTNAKLGRLNSVGFYSKECNE